MTSQHKPKASPLPDPLKGADKGSFAHYSVARRLPDIAGRVQLENQLEPEATAQIDLLISEIPEGRIRRLSPSAAPDAGGWDTYVAQYKASNWLDVPWFFAETYFYRRILEATGYFESSPGTARDPYAQQKSAGLTTSLSMTGALCAEVARWHSWAWHASSFATLLSSALWANQMDLSLWPVGKEERPTHGGLNEQREHLLVDHSQAVFQHLSHLPWPSSLIFLIDNAGFELVCDLLLADYMLTSGAAASVGFHLKIHPTFVSDAMPKDVRETTEFLATSEDANIAAFGNRLKSHLREGRLLLRSHPFWTSPLEGWRMPAGLITELASCDLVISKGDANYRRLLGDRHWEFTRSFEEILSYFPAPIVALRTLKSEVAAGLEPESVASLSRTSPEWMVNGRFGVIQYAAGKGRA